MKYDVLTTDPAGMDTSLATAEDGTCSMTATQLLTDLGITHETDVPLAPMTWYGVGGKAQCLAKPADEAELAKLMQGCNEQGIPVRILGSGATLLVSDDGVEPPLEHVELLRELRVVRQQRRAVGVFALARAADASGAPAHEAPVE